MRPWRPIEPTGLPINEPSFFASAGGEVGRFSPIALGSALQGSDIDRALRTVTESNENEDRVGPEVTKGEP